MRPLACADSPLPVLLKQRSCLRSVRVAKFGLVSTALLKPRNSREPLSNFGVAGSPPLLPHGALEKFLSLGSSQTEFLHLVQLSGVLGCGVCRWGGRRGRTAREDRLSITEDLDLFPFIHCKSESILFIFILPCCDTFKIHGTFSFGFSFNTF